MIIGVLLFPEFQLLDVAGPLEMFAAADGLQSLLVAATRDPLTPAKWPQVAFVPEADFTSAPHLDVLFVPGGIGVRHAIGDAATRDFLARRAGDAAYVTSVCTGALVLGAAGLLRGYRAATHWRYMDLLPMFGAAPADERIVRDRNRITSGGVTAGIDFGLELVAELRGIREAEKAQLALQYAPAPPFSAGHPSGAPRDVVDEVRADTQATHEARERLIREVLALESR